MRVLPAAPWILCAALAGVCFGQDDPKGPAPIHHVSSEGTPGGGSGTREKPFSLAEAVARADIQPGAAFHLKGGLYRIAYGAVPVIRWKGTAGARITLRSAPGEWAVIDGRIDVAKAEYVTLRDFEMTRTRDENVYDPRWWSLPIQERPSYSEKNGLRFKMGSDLIEVHESESIHLVNLYLHDNVSGGGVGAWNPARNTLIYGCLLIRNGWEDRVRGHGHGCYIQNGSGAKYSDSKKIFRHNMSAYNQATGMKSYGQAPEIRGTYFEGNFFFGNGMRAFTEGSNNYLAGTGQSLLDDIVLKDNHFYQPEKNNGGCVYLGWGGRNKGKCVFVNNRVCDAGNEAIRVQYWKDLTFTGNTIYGPKRLFTVADTDGRMGKWVWDGNTYWDPPHKKSIRTPQGTVSFEGWKEQTGFDRSSKRLPGKPKGIETFILPNDHDPDRAHVAVYNWDRLGAVDLDLSSFLKPGNEFVVYHALDYRGKPVARGKYSGGPVKVETRTDDLLGNEFQGLILQRLTK